MGIEITALMSWAERAAEGMSDYQNVGADEDAHAAAVEIVEYWETEGGEGGLLTRADAEIFEESGGTSDDMDDIRGRCIDIIERAILANREVRRVDDVTTGMVAS